MKLINIILSVIVGIVVFLLLTSFFYTFISKMKPTQFIFWWTLANAWFANYLGVDFGKKFYKWFKSGLR